MGPAQRRPRQAADPRILHVPDSLADVLDSVKRSHRATFSFIAPLNGLDVLSLSTAASHALQLQLGPGAWADAIISFAHRLTPGQQGRPQLAVYHVRSTLHGSQPIVQQWRESLLSGLACLALPGPIRAMVHEAGEALHLLHLVSDCHLEPAQWMLLFQATIDPNELSIVWGGSMHHGSIINRSSITQVPLPPVEAPLDVHAPEGSLVLLARGSRMLQTPLCLRSPSAPDVTFTLRRFTNIFIPSAATVDHPRGPDNLGAGGVAGGRQDREAGAAAHAGSAELQAQGTVASAAATTSTAAVAAGSAAA